MLRKTLVDELAEMSAAERILLAQDLWDSVANDPEAWVLSPAQRRELSRRLKAYRRRKAAGRTAGSSWREVKKRIRRKA